MRSESTQQNKRHVHYETWTWRACDRPLKLQVTRGKMVVGIYVHKYIYIYICIYICVCATQLMTSESIPKNNNLHLARLL